jgi:ribosomal protein S18 acetylase RimI-like enzyme
VTRREPVEHRVERADDSDTDGIVEMLVRAFEDDPVAGFMFANVSKRPQSLRKFFSIQMKADYLKTGEVWMTEDHTGAALWGPPNKPLPNVRDLLHLLPLMPALLPLGHMRKAMRALFIVESFRPKYPHWYLATIGTDPPAQGRGIGSVLMSTMMERIDKEGAPAYLESSKERNVPFYSRYGFKVSKELRAVDGAPPIWLMLREAQGAS